MHMNKCIREARLRQIYATVSLNCNTPSLNIFRSPIVIRYQDQSCYTMGKGIKGE